MKRLLRIIFGTWIVCMIAIIAIGYPIQKEIRMYQLVNDMWDIGEYYGAAKVKMFFKNKISLDKKVGLLIVSTNVLTKEEIDSLSQNLTKREGFTFNVSFK